MNFSSILVSRQGNEKESFIYYEITSELYNCFQNDIWHGSLGVRFPDLKDNFLSNSLSISLKNFRSDDSLLIRKVLDDQVIDIQDNISFGSSKITLDYPLLFTITIECLDKTNGTIIQFDYSKVLMFRKFVMNCLSLRLLEKVFKIFLYHSIAIKNFTDFNLFLIDCMIYTRKFKDSGKFNPDDIKLFELGVSVYQKYVVSFFLFTGCGFISFYDSFASVTCF